MGRLFFACSPGCLSNRAQIEPAPALAYTRLHTDLNNNKMDYLYGFGRKIRKICQIC